MGNKHNLWNTLHRFDVFITHFFAFYELYCFLINLIKS